MPGVFEIVVPHAVPTVMSMRMEITPVNFKFRLLLKGPHRVSRAFEPFMGTASLNPNNSRTPRDDGHPLPPAARMKTDTSRKINVSLDYTQPNFTSERVGRVLVGVDHG